MTHCKMKKAKHVYYDPSGYAFVQSGKTDNKLLTVVNIQERLRGNLDCTSHILVVKKKSPKQHMQHLERTKIKVTILKNKWIQHRQPYKFKISFIILYRNYFPFCLSFKYANVHTCIYPAVQCPPKSRLDSLLYFPKPIQS